MEITWKIHSLERLTETGQVTCVHYYVYVDDDGNEHARTKCHKLNLTGEVTTPYADLTPAQVTGWVKDAIGADAIAALENEVAQYIPIEGQEEGLPW